MVSKPTYGEAEERGNVSWKDQKKMIIALMLKLAAMPGKTGQMLTVWKKHESTHLIPGMMMTMTTTTIDYNVWERQLIALA